MFQSTYLYKVRRAAYAKTLAETKFQSTYLYKVRLYADDVPDPNKNVSIHVPI